MTVSVCLSYPPVERNADSFLFGDIKKYSCCEFSFSNCSMDMDFSDCRISVQECSFWMTQRGYSLMRSHQTVSQRNCHFLSPSPPPLTSDPSVFFSYAHCCNSFYFVSDYDFKPFYMSNYRLFFFNVMSFCNTWASFL